ncbi:MAG: hypothetical protein ACRD4J_11025 [Nitrososphaeraceae archaeon]
MFGPKKKEEKQSEEKPIIYHDVYYMGGHILYPEPFPTAVVLWKHALEVKPDLYKDAAIVMRYEEIKEQQHEQNRAQKISDLSPSAVKATAGYLSDFVVMGHRHSFYVYLTGMIFYYGISLKSASEIVTLLCNVTNDEEKKSRLETLRLTYEKGLKGIPLKGGKSLADLISTTVSQYSRNKNMEAAKVTLEILRKIWSKDISIVAEPDEEGRKKLSQQVIEMLRPIISLLFKDGSDTAFAAIKTVLIGGGDINTLETKQQQIEI